MKLARNKATAYNDRLTALTSADAGTPLVNEKSVGSRIHTGESDSLRLRSEAWIQCKKQRPLTILIF